MATRCAVARSACANSGSTRRNSPDTAQRIAPVFWRRPCVKTKPHGRAAKCAVDVQHRHYGSLWPCSGQNVGGTVEPGLGGSCGGDRRYINPGGTMAGWLQPHVVRFDEPPRSLVGRLFRRRVPACSRYQSETIASHAFMPDKRKPSWPTSIPRLRRTVFETVPQGERDVFRRRRGRGLVRTGDVARCGLCIGFRLR